MADRSREDWLRLIRDAAADSRRVQLTKHARERMGERGVTFRQVLNVLRHGMIEEEPAPTINPPGYWSLRLTDRSGVAVVVGLDPDRGPVVLHVITTMWG